MNYYTQQGDVLIKKCGTKGIFEVEYESIPEDATPLKTNLVLKGNTNSHALYGGEFTLLQKDNRLFLDVRKTTTLDHVKDLVSNQRAEHHAQEIPPGHYFVDALKEFDHIKEESRRVID